jgi:hypothetical protein
MRRIGQFSLFLELTPLTKRTYMLRDTLFAARMARDLLWDEEGTIPLNDFVNISQT